MNKTYYMRPVKQIVNIKKIVTIHFQQLPNDYNFSGESHNFWEIAYVDKNSITYNVDGNIKIVKEGEIIFIKPNTFHSLSCKDGANLLIISFDCSSNSLSYFFNRTITLSSSSIKILSKIINEAKVTFELPKFNPDLRKMEYLVSPSLGGVQVIKNYLEILLINLLRKEADKPTSSIIVITNSNLSIPEQIINILNDNIYQKLTLDKLCEMMKYEKSYLSDQFKKATGYSIFNYFLNLKINESKKLITKGKSFTEISSILNFDSPSHFSRTFKKYTKLSPKEFKQSLEK